MKHPQLIPPRKEVHRRSARPQRTLSLVIVAVAASVASAGEFTSVDIGRPAPKTGATTVVTAGKDYDVVGYGRMFLNHLGSDEGRFVYTEVAGDFDVAVQVLGVESSVAAYAEAGLMVRESLDPRCRAAAQFVTGNDYKHGADQYTFDFRLKEGGTLTPSATRFIYDFHRQGAHGNPTMGYAGRIWLNENTSRPRPFPEVWLRLRRHGNTFSGYWREGKDFWHKVTECEMELRRQVLVGLCLSANHHDPEITGKLGDPAQASSARFRDLQWLTELNELEDQPIKSDPR